MKKAINNVKNTNPNYGEVDLFRKIDNYISQNYNSAFVEETHQCYVTFNSGKCIQVKREISDLWIITFSKSSKEARMTFLQAKLEKKKKPLKNKFSFTGDYFQHDLLSQRHLLTKTSKFNFPTDILSNASSDAIGSFGVFYIDNSGDIDFVFSTASNLTCNPGSCNTRGRVLHLTKTNSQASIISNSSGNRELLDAFYISEFETSLLALEIGSEFHNNSVMLNFVQSSLGAIPGIANTTTYADFNSLLNTDSQIGDTLFEYYPSILLINIDPFK